MKKLIALLVFVFSLSFVSATTIKLDGNSNGHNYSVLKITLDGKSKIVVPIIDNGESAQSLKDLMDNVGGTHAINGGFFCPNEAAYSWCGKGTTDGLRKSNGTLYSRWGKDIAEGRSVFGFDIYGNASEMAERDERYWEDGARQNHNVEKIQNGIMMPTLVKNGINVAVLNSEMNKDGKQKTSGNKTFICSQKDGKIIYMGFIDKATFSSLADYIIQTFDCYNAIQLDNGGTKAMINNGKYVAGPGRKMMDAFVVIEDNSKESEKEITDDNDKLGNAISWMYKAGLTIYDNKKDFLPNKNMTREEAAKFFSLFAKQEFGLEENTNNSCDFNDIKHADQTLVSSINSSCKLGIFKGHKNKFMFKDKLNNAQAITVLMRIMFGTMEEPSSAYYSNYLLKAKEIGLISEMNTNENITRGNAAILLYDANIYKEEIKSELNTNKIEQQESIQNIDL